ncbi:MAG: hypothetical protein JWQ81_3660 [Amycolatopsis sp.]|uniref:hypothetical protein n=1 Tax=Amycolatopsis sp. TaxID=37632 RepID=UPI00262A0F27|nr:hypothetical protein [Amycolatopsis sp.]MCU1682921.1 hypothetical protein [Amycolatopsis sp.]
MRSQVAERLESVTDEINAVKALRGNLLARVGKRKMTMDEFDVANEPLVLDLASLEAQEKALAEQIPAEPVAAESEESLIAEWNDGDVSARRGMLLKTLGRNKMVVFPTVHTGKRVFDNTRVKKVTPKEFAALAEAHASTAG